MKPKFTTTIAWQQAEVLMQPALIRLVDNIQKKLDRSPWKGHYRETHVPYPGYQLDLEVRDRQVSVDIWELCYKICFRNYRPTHAPQETYEVEIDTTLLDDTGDVNWENLDAKAEQVAGDVFESLPQETA
ncbi:hypothetical protein IQ235_18020 [Oscillatoriales cyanobacterium LEGE 11467]|uniref:Uncharacterized protein n=1 Tax=Zarconia navalis LEGE 11467 TaxID=1828826 RepID=A0A928W289_9CYAN|nr:hypothetical protein [Zarconia navalis]MBE9042661.1 hypothetical protein [Zarconia navalis LEGE 11467]